MHTVPSGVRRPLAMRLWPCSLDEASVQLNARDVSECGRSVGWSEANQSEATRETATRQWS